MLLLKKFFSRSSNSPSVQQEYQQIKKEQSRSFFKLSLGTSASICIYTGILCIIYKSYHFISLYFALAGICGLIWLFAHRLKRYMDIILFFACSILIVFAYVNISSRTSVSEISAPVFITGYIYGAYERVVSLSMPDFRYKIVFSIMLFIIRMTLISQVELYLQLYQVILLIFIVGLDYCREKQDRSLFQSFYNYREGLTKFKNLLVSGLPTNVLILSKDLKKELFKNDCIQNTAGIQDQSPENSIKLIHQWLNSLIIDKLSLTGNLLDSLIPNKDPVKQISVFNFLQNLLPNSQQKFSFNIHSEESTPRAFETKLFPLTWDNTEATALIFNDVTEQHQNLTLKVADSNKDKMLAMISHELRTPLNGILGMVNILKKEIQDPQQLRYLTVCHNSGELLLNLVNSILDLQQIRDKKFVLKFAQGDLHELLRGIYDLFKFQFDQKGLYLRLDIAHNVPEQMLTDQNRLRQILINLIGNAFKFTFKGGVHIYVMVDPEREDFIHFKVTDTGTGIKEEDMNKLFKMYGRLDQPDPNTNTQGVGLGLEISNQLVRLLSDDKESSNISVASKLKEGTTFAFSIKDQSKKPNSMSFDEPLPHIFSEDIENISIKISPYLSRDLALTERGLLRNASEGGSSVSELKSTNSFVAPVFGGGLSIFKSQTEQQISHSLFKRHSRLASQAKEFNSLGFGKGIHLDSTALSPVHLRPKRAKSLVKIVDRAHILLVDDNPFNLLVAKHLIESLGYVVNTVLNGQLAIEEIKSSKNLYSAVLMDLQMPVMDGYETTRELKKMMENQEIPKIPIIAVSANDSKADKKRCEEAGMYDHIPKPLKEESVRRILNKALDLSESDNSFEEIEEIS